MLLDPGEYKPRISKKRIGRLPGEFEKQVGDPNLGGSDNQKGTLAAYRQSALQIAFYLDDKGPSKASDVTRQTDDTKARDILLGYKNQYYLAKELRINEKDC